VEEAARAARGGGEVARAAWGAVEEAAAETRWLGRRRGGSGGRQGEVARERRGRRGEVARTAALETRWPARKSGSLTASGERESKLP